MSDWDFSYEDRLQDIEQSIADYTQLKQMSETSSLISISPNLIKTIENSLVIAIYSLSEQLLKDKIYNILQVRFIAEEQSSKDKYILKQMPPERYPITPDLDRIRKELRVFYPEFKLYFSKINKDYKDSYVKLIKARHEYAHANNHTSDLDFDAAKRFVEYLKLHYDDIEVGNINKLETLEKKIFNLCKSSGYLHFESQKQTINDCFNRIKELEDSYFISYIDDVYSFLSEIVDDMNNVTEKYFQEEIEEIKDKLQNVWYIQ